VALLEVDVDGVIPAPAAVLQGPDLAGAELGRGRDPPEIRGEHGPAAVPDAPGAEEGCDGIECGLFRVTTELEDPPAGHGDGGVVRVRAQDGRHLAHVGTGRVPYDPELQELPHAGVGRVSGQGPRDGEVLQDLPAVRPLVTVACAARFTIQSLSPTLYLEKSTTMS